MSATELPAPFALTMKRGDSYPIAITIDHTYLPQNGITGLDNIRFTAKTAITDLDAAAIISKIGPTGSDMTVKVAGNNTDTDGVIWVNLLPANTSDMADTDVTLHWDVQLKRTVETRVLISTPAEGTLVIKPDYTRTAT